MINCESGAGPDEFRDTARDLAEGLSREAVWHSDLCTYLTPTFEPRGSANVVYCNCDGGLYGGTSGIARFLAHAHRLFGDLNYRDTAIGALAYAVQHEKGYGLYQGRTGVALTLVEVGLVLDDPALVERGASLAHSMSAEVRDHADQTSDLLYGSAGTALGFAWLGTVLEEPGFIEISLTLAHRCADKGRERAEGISWPDPDHGTSDSDHLSGLAHGTSGIAFALNSVATLAGGDERLANVAAEARRYDMSAFEPQSAGWMDLRTPEGQSQGLHFWCHGSAGVAVDRLWACRTSNEEYLLAQAAAAAAGTSQWARNLLDGPHGPGAAFDSNLSVCHGMMGAADVLLEVALLSGANEPLAIAKEIGQHALASHKAEGVWRCGLLGAGPLPGFMLGKAGIGHVLLRLSDAPDVPPATLPPLAGHVLAQVEI